MTERLEVLCFQEQEVASALERFQFKEKHRKLYDNETKMRDSLTAWHERILKEKKGLSVRK